MSRVAIADRDDLRRGAWTAEEDEKLRAYVGSHGTGHWRSVGRKAGLQRCGKSCRLRWTNYLRPNIRHGSFTPYEEDLIVKLHSSLGSRWSLIAARMPGRTDNDIKNHWNTRLKKKLSSSIKENNPTNNLELSFKSSRDQHHGNLIKELHEISRQFFPAASHGSCRSSTPTTTTTTSGSRSSTTASQLVQRPPPPPFWQQIPTHCLFSKYGELLQLFSNKVKPLIQLAFGFLFCCHSAKIQPSKIETEKNT
ncbi:unnamed protein product, partial [Sphagnum troendelagicum]